MLGNSPVIWCWQPVWLKNIWPLNLYLLFLVLLSLTSTRYAGYMFIGFIVARIVFIPTAAHRKFVGRAFQSFCIVKSLVFLTVLFKLNSGPGTALPRASSTPLSYLTRSSAFDTFGYFLMHGVLDTTLSWFSLILYACPLYFLMLDASWFLTGLNRPFLHSSALFRSLNMLASLGAAWL